MVDIAAQHWSRRIRLVRVPRWLLNTIAKANSALAGLTGNAPMLTPPKLRELRHSDWVADNHAITAATGWTPKIGLREGLEQLKLPTL
jgi:nucleoside-diphosphate-sugar epimerase